MYEFIGHPLRADPVISFTDSTVKQHRSCRVYPFLICIADRWLNTYILKVLHIKLQSMTPWRSIACATLLLACI